MTDFPPIRKAVFPVAGLGTRFLPATKSIPKEMLPIVDKPLIQYAVDEAVEAGIIEPIDSGIAGMAWFGALNEVVMRWLMSEQDGRLDDAYPTLRSILLRSVGIPEDRLAALAQA